MGFPFEYNLYGFDYCASLCGECTYNIEVEIENKYGCKDTQDFDVRVYTNPVALFATNDTAQCVDVHRFNFTNQSTSSRSLTYVWDFGDTSNATGTNAFKVYTSYGRRTVSLVARDNLGCADTMLESIYVAPYPI